MRFRQFSDTELINMESTLSEKRLNSLVNEIRQEQKYRTDYPTEKQIKYAKYLGERMCKELPKENTKRAYSEFISKWKPVVKSENDSMNEPDTWQIQYM